MFPFFLGSLSKNREEQEIKAKELDAQIDAELKEIDDLFEKISPEAHAKINSLKVSSSDGKNEVKKVTVQEIRSNIEKIETVAKQVSIMSRIAIKSDLRKLQKTS